MFDIRHLYQCWIMWVIFCCYNQQLSAWSIWSSSQLFESLWLPFKQSASFWTVLGFLVFGGFGCPSIDVWSWLVHNLRMCFEEYGTEVGLIFVLNEIINWFFGEISFAFSRVQSFTFLEVLATCMHGPWPIYHLAIQLHNLSVAEGVWLPEDMWYCLFLWRQYLQYPPAFHHLIAFILILDRRCLSSLGPDTLSLPVWQPGR